MKEIPQKILEEGCLDLILSKIGNTYFICDWKKRLIKHESTCFCYITLMWEAEISYFGLTFMDDEEELDEEELGVLNGAWQPPNNLPTIE